MTCVIVVSPPDSGLEEGDREGGGESPCSEASGGDQTPRGAGRAVNQAGREVTQSFTAFDRSTLLVNL